MTARVFGVTGRMGTGKSYAIEQLATLFAADEVTFTAIRVDDIRRDVIGTNLAYAALRQKVADHFIVPAAGPEYQFDRMALAEAVFAKPEGPADFWFIAGPAILYETAKIIRKADGYAAIEWPRLAEDGFLPLITENVLVMTCSDDALAKRFVNSDLSPAQIKARLALQVAIPPSYAAPWIFDTSHNPAASEYAALYRGIRYDLDRRAA